MEAEATHREPAISNSHLVDDPTFDPDSVDSLFANVSDVSDNKFAPGSTTTVSPSDRSEPQSDQPPTASESQVARSEPSNSVDDDDDVSRRSFFPLPSLSSRRLSIATCSLLADRLNTSARMQHITRHRRRTISVNDIHDCLLKLLVACLSHVMLLAVSYMST